MMTDQRLTISASITVLKPAADVFKAVLTPTPYFVATASGPLVEGKTIVWRFPEFPADCPVIVESVVPNEFIRFQWESGAGGQNTCDFRFNPLDADGLKAAAAQGVDGTKAVTVTVSESGWPDTEDGRKFSYQNLMGWTQMICALKAHVEHGVNLRRGAFVHFKFS